MCTSAPVHALGSGHAGSPTLLVLRSIPTSASMNFTAAATSSMTDDEVGATARGVDVVRDKTLALARHGDSDGIQ